MNEKNLSLKDRLKDAGTLKEKGITDFSRIDEIIKDLGDEKLNEKVIAAPNREKFTKFITEYVTPASGNLDVPDFDDATFRDFMKMCNDLMEDDVDNFLLYPDTFNHPELRTNLDQMSFALLYFFSVFAPYKSGKTGKNACIPLKEFLDIKYTAFREYLRTKYEYTSFAILPVEELQSISENTGMSCEEYLDTLTMRDIINDINTRINRHWIPFNSLSGFMSEVRLGYRQLYQVFFLPLSIVYLGKGRAFWFENLNEFLNREVVTDTRSENVKQTNRNVKIISNRKEQNT